MRHRDRVNDDGQGRDEEQGQGARVGHGVFGHDQDQVEDADKDDEGEEDEDDEPPAFPGAHLAALGGMVAVGQVANQGQKSFRVFRGVGCFRRN